MNHPFIRIMCAPGAPARQENQDCQKEPAPPLRSTAPKESKYLSFDPAGIPQVLRDHPHWLVSGTSGRPVRKPGVGDSKTTPAHWADFAKVSQIVTGKPKLWPYIVLTADSPFTVFDVDFKPRRESGEEAETPAQYEARLERAGKALGRLREHFPARYESRSKSGKGFHIIVRGKFYGTGGKGKKGGEWADVEIYTKGHGIALTGHVSQDCDNPAPYPAEKIQALRDEIKGEAPGAENWENMPDRGSHGSVSPVWARQVLAELERLHGRPGRDAWRDMSSAVFDGVGVETGIELLEEVWPEEKRGEYKKLAKSLQWFAPWVTLRGYGVNPDDPEELPFLMPDMTEGRQEEPHNSASFPIFRAGDVQGTEDTLDFVENMLTEGGASVIYGPSNCGKSFWVLDLAASIATGSAFRGELEVDQGAVIYVALEGSQGAKNRIEAMRREGKLSEDSPLFLCFAPVSLLEKAHIAKLAATVKDAADRSGLPCRLVILDTLARAMAGGDENSGKEMGAAVKAMDAVREATGAHVLLVHHCGKDEARGARGHSSLRAAVDTEIEISRPEGTTISTVRVTKQRDLQAGGAMPFSLKAVTLRLNRRAKPVTSCVVHHEGEELAAKPRRVGRKAKATPEDMLRLLPAASVKEWKERVIAEIGLGASRFYDHKRDLESDGKIRTEAGTGRLMKNDLAQVLIE